MPAKTTVKKQKRKLPPKLALTDEEEWFQRNRRAIIAGLRRVGAVEAVGNYSGSGDDGQINDITLYKDAKYGQEVTKTTTVPYIREHSRWEQGGEKWVRSHSKEQIDLKEAIEDFMCDYISKHYSGYENNDGGGGTCTFSAKTGECRWNHYWMSETYDGERLI